MNFNARKIEKYWEKYIAGFEPIPEHLDGLDDCILDSWKRSKQKANPFESNPVPLSNDQYQKLMKDNETLIEIALPYMIKFYEIAKSATQNVLLTDSNGMQLKNVSSDSQNLLELMSKVYVTNGIDYSEENCGTSSVSLSLYEDKPILLRGAEHYRKLYHELACFSAPIHSIDNKQVGCICITGQLKNYQPFIMSALIMMIEAIENEYRLRQTHDILNKVTENIQQGFLLINEKFDILLCNNKANQILEIKTNIVNHNINEYFIEDFPQLKAQNNNNYSFTKINGIKIHVSITLIPIIEHNEKLYLIIFSSLSDVTKETSQHLGYQAKYEFKDILGQSKEIKSIKELALLASNTNSNVLITGENGTGKELFAQAIHNASVRKDAPFIAMHCSSIPKQLMGTELFGDETTYQMGKIELAHQGTIFLDEIENLSLEMQTKLFDFIQNRTIDNTKLDVRIIASSNIDLFHLVETKQFRDDLYYSLNVISLSIPPLRKRRNDIPLLINYYFSHYRTLLKRDIKGIERDCLELLINYNWPGNIRQLESTIEHMINISKGSYVRYTDLPDHIITETLTSKYHNNDIETILSPETIEYREIIQAIKKEHGHMKTAAKLLNIPLSTLYRKCTKYNIDPKQFREW